MSFFKHECATIISSVAISLPTFLIEPSSMFLLLVGLTRLHKCAGSSEPLWLAQVDKYKSLMN